MQRYAGIVVLISLVVPGGYIGFDPLKQFPRVIHGNHPVQGRIAMGSPAPDREVDWGMVAGKESRPTIFKFYNELGNTRFSRSNL